MASANIEWLGWWRSLQSSRPQPGDKGSSPLHNCPLDTQNCWKTSKRAFARHRFALPCQSIESWYCCIGTLAERFSSGSSVKAGAQRWSTAWHWTSGVHSLK